jgi:hypothetical protein
MSSTTYPEKRPKTAILANEFNFLAVKSRTHRDFGNVNKIVKPDHFASPGKMYAAQEQFRDITKLVTKRHQFASIGNMVRNAGQLPQPFWLGAACGGGSHSLSASVARA